MSVSTRRQETASLPLRRPRIFYGWYVAMALAFLTSATQAGTYTFGLALQPISLQFGLDRAQLALAITMYTFLAGLLQPISGYLADRFGSRQLGVTGAVVLGLALLSLSYARSLPAIYLTYGVLGGLGASMMAGGVSAKIISAWFVERRGTAMSLAGASAIIAQIAVVPLATVLLGATNWQTADRFVALLIVLVIAPMGWWLIRNTPSEKGTYPDGNAESAARVASESGAGLTFRQAIRQPAFWQLTAGLFTCGVTMSFPSSHLMAYAGDMGMSDMTASETIGLAGLLSLPGALALGFLGDRSSRTKMLAVAYLLRSITYLVLLQAHNPTIMLAAGVSLGLSWGATVPLTSAIVADLFGCKAIATIVTTMTMVMFMASGTFSYLAGLDFTVFGNYSAALISAAVLGAIACVCCFTIRERSLAS